MMSVHVDSRSYEVEGTKSYGNEKRVNRKRGNNWRFMVQTASSNKSWKIKSSAAKAKGEKKPNN